MTQFVLAPDPLFGLTLKEGEMSELTEERAEPFSRSVQKRIEAQTGQKLFTQAELDHAVADARRDRDNELADWLINDGPVESEIQQLIEKRIADALALHEAARRAAAELLYRDCAGNTDEPPEDRFIERLRSLPSSTDILAQHDATVRREMVEKAAAILEYRLTDQQNDYPATYRFVLQKLLAEIRALTDRPAVEADEPEPEKVVQTSGPQCKRCGAFTTFKRVSTHGLCMKCENANAASPEKPGQEG